MNPLTFRQQAEAIEQFGDDLAALCRKLDNLCGRLCSEAVDGINAIPNQDHLDTVAEAFRALGAKFSLDCDAYDEAEDRRRDNPLCPNFRRLGQ
jgi:hypothetical protein